MKGSGDKNIVEHSLAFVMCQTGKTVTAMANAVPDEAWLHVCQLRRETAVIIPLQQVFTMVTESGLQKVNGLVLCGRTGSEHP